MGYISDGTAADVMVEPLAPWRAETLRRLFVHPESRRAGYELRGWAAEVLRVIERDDIPAPEVKILPRERGRYVIHYFWECQGREMTMALTRPGIIRWMADLPIPGRPGRRDQAVHEIVKGRPHWMGNIRALLCTIFPQRGDYLDMPETVLAQIGGRW